MICFCLLIPFLSDTKILYNEAVGQIRFLKNYGLKNYCLILTCPASAKCWLSADRHLVFRPRDRFQRALVLLVLHGLALSREESKNARRLLLHCILQHEQNIHISENINLSKKSYFKKGPRKIKKTHLKTKTKMKNIKTNKQAKHKKITKSKQAKHKK